MDDLLIKKAELEGDIRLLEKQKHDLLIEIDQLATSKSTLQEGYDKDISTLEEKKELLIRETTLLEANLTKLQDSYQKMESYLLYIKDTEVKRINEEFLNERQLSAESKMELEKRIGMIDEGVKKLEEKESEVKNLIDSQKRQETSIQEQKQDLARVIIDTQKTVEKIRGIG